MIYACRTCKITFHVTQWLCQACFYAPDAENVAHKQQHDFVKCKLVEDPKIPDSSKERYFCETCRTCRAIFQYI